MRRKMPRNPLFLTGEAQEKAKEEICERISDGEPLRSICRSEGMPKWRTVYQWMDADEEFLNNMEAARAIGADAIAEEALRIADTPLEGIETEESENGLKIKKSDMLGHRKLQVETRLKLLAKWHPKKYGVKLTAEHTGKDGAPLQINIVRFGNGDNKSSE